jgi:anti-sigma regulatory factor (Ser/Thr protein kinase)
MMTKEISIELTNDFNELNRLNNILEEYCDLNELPSNILFAMNLSLEEVITNVISYGYEDDKEHQINIRIRLDCGGIEIEVEDDGKPFNPLEKEDPDIDASIEERPIGGLGIYLVRNYMDDLVYKRSGGKNLLFMKKRLG